MTARQKGNRDDPRACIVNFSPAARRNAPKPTAALLHRCALKAAKNLRHTSRQQEPGTPSACSLGARCRTARRVGARYAPTCAANPSTALKSIPPGAACALKSGAEGGAPVNPRHAVTPPTPLPESLRCGESAPLWSDGREPCCARQTAVRASTAAQTTPQAAWRRVGVAATCAKPPVGLRLRSRRRAASPHARRQSAAAAGGCACPAARGARVLAPSGACVARGHRWRP